MPIHRRSAVFGADQVRSRKPEPVIPSKLALHGAHFAQGPIANDEACRIRKISGRELRGFVAQEGRRRFRHHVDAPKSTAMTGCAPAKTALPHLPQ
jgi:hypothetical protein